MKNKRRIVGILAAVILATIGTVALVGYVQSAKDKAVAQERMVEVYVVDKLVPKGAAAETIKASVSVEQIPARLEQPGAITDLDAVGRNVAAADLQPGDQLLAARLVPKDEVAVEVKDKVQVSAMLTPERAVGGTLKKGDLVGVYLSFDPFEYDKAGYEPETVDAIENTGSAGTTDAAASTDATTDPESTDTSDTAATTDTSSDGEEDKQTPNVTRLEFQHVLVTNVQTTNEPVLPDESDQGDADDFVEQVTGSQYIVTLALSPEQSERFVFATEFGKVWLSNDPATVSDDGTRLVTLGNVYSVVK
jgi:pilus assembly protein CpaB